MQETCSPISAVLQEEACRNTAIKAVDSSAQLPRPASSQKLRPTGIKPRFIPGNPPPDNNTAINISSHAFHATLRVAQKFKNALRAEGENSPQAEQAVVLIQQADENALNYASGDPGRERMRMFLNQTGSL